ncbi:hypothetical protein CBS101457_001021 [Exobasidium rhododendri]|nr:hypothetical protein CBS101457_001021 [Exobasidium rhododendri]
MTMTVDVSDSKSSSEGNTKFWDFSLAPGARPLFGNGGYLSTKGKKSNRKTTTATAEQNQFARDFVVSPEVEKSLKNANGFAMDGCNTTTRDKDTKRACCQRETSSIKCALGRKNNSLETLVSNNQDTVFKDDASAFSFTSSTFSSEPNNK